MSARITLVDYGIGNVYSVSRAFEKMDCAVDLTSDPEKIRNAEKLVLPGVGAFADCMNELKARGLVDTILDFTRTGRPFIGMCVGMQLMFERGFEFGEHAGLGLIAGSVTEIPRVARDGSRLKVPHIGWGALVAPRAGEEWKGSILQNTPEKSAVYFVHSFGAVPADSADVLAEVEYGGNRIVAAVRKGNWFGCQFHPERSGPVGLEIIRTFGREL